jgi:OmpA-OmpF porin, OOP family
MTQPASSFRPTAHVAGPAAGHAAGSSPVHAAVLCFRQRAGAQRSGRCPASAPKRWALPALAALGVALSTGLAQAQQRVSADNGAGTDTHMFRPAVDSKGFFTVNGAEVLGHKDVSFGLVTDYGRNLMRLKSGHGQPALVTHSFQGTFGLNVGLFNRLALGLNMPVNLMQGEGVTSVGPTGAEYDTQRLDGQTVPFVATHAKLRILKNDEIIGLALVAQVGVPVSKASRDLGGDPKPWFWPQLVLERSIGEGDAVRIGLNVGYRGGSFGAQTRFDQLSAGRFESSDGKLAGGAAIAVRALDKLEFVAEMYGTKQVGSKSSEGVSQSTEAIGGLKLFVERNSYLMIGGGVRIGDGYEAADQRGFLGFMFEPSIGDKDGDGIADDEDRCPTQPEDRDGFQDSDGCPDPDNDKDGIPDKRDACPDIAETVNGWQDDDGCPDTDNRDTDGDGLPDRLDRCPKEAEDKDNFEDTDGCPDLDNDRDGIPDDVDKCPNEPEDKDGFEDEDGCPEFDNDNDGIPDDRDKCPNEAETVNGFQDEDGCPDKVQKGPVIIEGNSLQIIEKVQFERGSAKIRKVSSPLLDAVASILKEHPEFSLIEVQGHADASGSAKLNLTLTQARAAAVVEAIVGRGVPKARLRPMGYGMYCPLDPGRSAQAFEKNRRVEFKIVIAEGKPTGVELGCPEAERNGVSPPPAP